MALHTELETAKDILRYFLRNPQAADSVEGVARWRFLGGRIHHSLEETKKALGWLVAKGLLLEISTAGSGPIFRLTVGKRAEAERFVGGMAQQGPEQSQSLLQEFLSRREETKMDDSAQNLVRSYLGIYDNYHNQKEAIAYSATTLYLVAVSALLIQDPFWRDYALWELGIFLAVLVVLSLLAFVFVANQLSLRRSAGDIYRACSRLAAKWVHTPPNQKELEPIECRCHGVLIGEFSWPMALHDEIDTVVSSRKRIWWPRDISFAAMFLLGVLALIKVILTWKC